MKFVSAKIAATWPEGSAVLIRRPKRDPHNSSYLELAIWWLPNRIHDYVRTCWPVSSKPERTEFMLIRRSNKTDK